MRRLYIVTLVPLYLIVSKIGLTDKRFFWLIWGLQGTSFLIFFRIMFPLVQTALIIAAIFAFQWSWSNYLMPVLFLRWEKVTLAVKLANGYTDIKKNILHNIGMAGIVYYTLQIVIVFFTLQKRFIAGLLSGGLKG